MNVSPCRLTLTSETDIRLRRRQHGLHLLFRATKTKDAGQRRRPQLGTAESDAGTWRAAIAALVNEYDTSTWHIMRSVSIWRAESSSQSATFSHNWEAPREVVAEPDTPLPLIGACESKNAAISV